MVMRLWLILSLLFCCLPIQAEVQQVRHHRSEDFQNAWGRFPILETYTLSTFTWDYSLNQAMETASIYRTQKGERDAMFWGGLPAGESPSQIVAAHGKLWVFTRKKDTWSLHAAEMNRPQANWLSIHSRFVYPVLRFALDTNADPYVLSLNAQNEPVRVQGRFLGGGNGIDWGPVSKILKSDFQTFREFGSGMGGASLIGEFDVKQSAQFLAFTWNTPEDGVQVRYRVSEGDGRPYGAWSAPFLERSIILNKLGRFFQYQLIYNTDHPKPDRPPDLILSYRVEPFGHVSQTQPKGEMSGVLALHPTPTTIPSPEGFDMPVFPKPGVNPPLSADTLDNRPSISSSDEDDSVPSTDSAEPLPEGAEGNVDDSPSDFPIPLADSGDKGGASPISPQVSAGESSTGGANPAISEGNSPASTARNSGDRQGSENPSPESSSSPNAESKDTPRTEETLEEENGQSPAENDGHNHVDPESGERSHSETTSEKQEAQLADASDPRLERPVGLAAGADGSGMGQGSGGASAEQNGRDQAGTEESSSNGAPQLKEFLTFRPQSQEQGDSTSGRGGEPSQSGSAGGPSAPSTEGEDSAKINSGNGVGSNAQGSGSSGNPAQGVDAQGNELRNDANGDAESVLFSRSGSPESEKSPTDTLLASVPPSRLRGFVPDFSIEQGLDNLASRLGAMLSKNASSNVVEEATPITFGTSGWNVMPGRFQPQSGWNYLWLLLLLLAILFTMMLFLLFRREEEDDDRVPIVLEAFPVKEESRLLADIIHQRFSSVVESVDYDAANWEGILRLRPDIVAAAIQGKQAAWLLRDRTLLLGSVEAFLHALQLEHEIGQQHQAIQQFKLDHDIRVPRLTLLGNRLIVQDQDVLRRNYAVLYHLKEENSAVRGTGRTMIKGLDEVKHIWVAQSKVWVSGLRGRNRRVLSGFWMDRGVDQWKEEIPSAMKEGVLVTATRGKDPIVAGKISSDMNSLLLYAKKASGSGWQAIAKTPFASEDAILFSDAKHCFLIELTGEPSSIPFHVLTRNVSGQCTGRHTAYIELPIRAHVESVEMVGGRLFILARENAQLMLFAARLGELLEAEVSARAS